MIKKILRFLGFVHEGERFEVCEYLSGMKEMPTRGGGGMWMISYLVPGLSESPGKVRVIGNMPIEPISAGKLRAEMGDGLYYARKIKRYLDSWGVDLQALETVPADVVDLPTRAPRGWWERNTKLYPWWVGSASTEVGR